MAEKYFGNTDPMGKVLVFDKKDNFTVTGVLADFPVNSSVNYDIIFPTDRLARIYSAGGDMKPMDEDLDNFLYTTYIQLKPTGSPAAVQQKLTAIYRDKVGGGPVATESVRVKAAQGAGTTAFPLQYAQQHVL